MGGKKIIQFIISKTGPGVFIGLCDQNPKPTRQARMLFIWGGDRRQRKQVNMQLFTTATSGSGSIPGRGIQTTLQKFSFWPGLKQFGRAGHKWPQSSLPRSRHHLLGHRWTCIKILSQALVQWFPTRGAAQDNLPGCWKNTFFSIVNKYKIKRIK